MTTATSATETDFFSPPSSSNENHTGDRTVMKKSWNYSTTTQDNGTDFYQKQHSFPHHANIVPQLSLSPLLSDIDIQASRQAQQYSEHDSNNSNLGTNEISPRYDPPLEQEDTWLRKKINSPIGGHISSKCIR
jgi:hypothetical protein